MTSKSAKEMIEVMQAFEAGNIIQVKGVDGRWVDVEHPSWNWHANDYRVKPWCIVITFLK